MIFLSIIATISNRYLFSTMLPYIQEITSNCCTKKSYDSHISFAYFIYKEPLEPLVTLGLFFTAQKGCLLGLIQLNNLTF